MRKHTVVAGVRNLTLFSTNAFSYAERTKNSIQFASVLSTLPRPISLKIYTVLNENEIEKGLPEPKML